MTQANNAIKHLEEIQDITSKLINHINLYPEHLDTDFDDDEDEDTDVATSYSELCMDLEEAYNALMYDELGWLG